MDDPRALAEEAEVDEHPHDVVVVILVLEVVRGRQHDVHCVLHLEEHEPVGAQEEDKREVEDDQAVDEYHEDTPQVPKVRVGLLLLRTAQAGRWPCAPPNGPSSGQTIIPAQAPLHVRVLGARHAEVAARPVVDAHRPSDPGQHTRHGEKRNHNILIVRDLHRVLGPEEDEVPLHVGVRVPARELALLIRQREDWREDLTSGGVLDLYAQRDLVGVTDHVWYVVPFVVGARAVRHTR
mmetsp:Transcript_30826/g.52878  ORF Transcript_30826/g.52878 Transcript_30826/m.52878 type:complete len:237 (-) Transcript_30826:118-828(-)